MLAGVPAEAVEPTNIRAELVCCFPTDGTQPSCCTMVSNGLDIAIRELYEMSYVGSQFKWCEKTMKKSKDTLALADCSQRKACTTIKRLIRNGLNGREVGLIFATLGDVRTIGTVFEFQIYMHDEGHNTVDFLPFCLPEVRIMFSGREIVIGIPPEVVRGETFKMKIDALYCMDFEAIVQMAKKNSGYVCELLANTFTVLPANMITVVITTIGTKGIRWSFVPSESEYPKIAGDMQVKLASFPLVGDARWVSLANILAIT